MIVANTVGGVYKLCVGGFHRNYLLVSTLPNVPTFTVTHTTTSKVWFSMFIKVWFLERVFLWTWRRTPKFFDVVTCSINT